MLGYAIPALSDATGRNSIGRIVVSGQTVFSPTDNINMSDSRNDWPSERKPDDFGLIRWRHSDLNDVAYLYVLNLYKDFVKIRAQLDKN
ncbi:MAG: hypothetical protein QM504_12725 [Pseudomonadota bacterium]